MTARIRLVDLYSVDASRRLAAELKRGVCSYFLPENLNQVCYVPSSQTFICAPEGPRPDACRIFPEIRDAWGRRSLVSHVDVAVRGRFDERHRCAAFSVYCHMSVCAFPSADRDSRKKPTQPDIAWTSPGSVSHHIPWGEELIGNISNLLRNQRQAGLYYSTRDYSVFRERLDDVSLHGASDHPYDLSPIQYLCSFSFEYRFNLSDAESLRANDPSFSFLRGYIKAEILGQAEAYFGEAFTVSLHAVPVSLSRQRISLALQETTSAEMVKSQITELELWQRHLACDCAGRNAERNAGQNSQQNAGMIQQAPQREFQNAILEFDDSVGDMRPSARPAQQQGPQGTGSQQRPRESPQRASRQQTRGVIQQQAREAVHDSPINPLDYQPPKRKIVLKKTPASDR